jgi:signal transduction histidine kinase
MSEPAQPPLPSPPAAPPPSASLSTRPPARRPQRQRTPLAGAVVLGIVGSLLLGWYWAGAADTSARAAAARRRPADEMRARVTAIADELNRDLDDLLRRESQRPYYHYSNLFRDPRSTSTGLSLSTSPLAAGPSEPLVADHFQVSAAGDVTLPTINEDAPELSERSRLADHYAARSRLRPVALDLRQRALHDRGGVAVAAAELLDPDLAVSSDDPAPPPRQANEPPVKQVKKPVRLEEDKMDKLAMRDARGEGPYPVGKKRKPTIKKTQVDRLDPEVYAQNAAPESVYKNIVSQQRKQASTVPVPVPSQNALRTLEGGRVNIVTAPLDWHTITLAGAPTLVALREVSTPDGTLVQGLTADRQAIERWLRDREVEDEVRLVHVAPPAEASDDKRASPGADPVDRGVEVIDEWSLVATPPASALAAAAARADAIERGFLLRFVGVAVVAALAGAFVILLMAGAERLARERSQFAAAAAHELRTPLAGLQLYGDMLADGLGDPSKTRDYARRLSEEAARLGRVVANVLGFSQLERGNLSLSLTSADLVPVLRELVARAEPSLDRLGAFVAVEMPATLFARFDRDAVLRIVGNLLDNAEKYGRGAEDRTITLSASSSSTDVEGPETVEIVVRDRGPGIDPVTARRLFRPFARGAGPDRPAGLGLGLALSRSLAEAMGGALAYRRAGEHTEFVLRLQASVTDAPSPQNAQN